MRDTKPVQLDPSKLLGLDQVDGGRGLARISSKVGVAGKPIER